MSETILYLVKFTGPFAFIKPWTAVRDIETYSQQFLTPSITEGIEKKLFPQLLGTSGIQKIKRHRLRYAGMSMQMEQTQTRGWNKSSKKMERPRSILYRGILLNPVLYLAFASEKDAQIASQQHICLCRNEDVLLPDEQIVTVTELEFDTNQEQYAGFELMFEQSEHAFLVGHNRWSDAEPMYGSLKTYGNPVRILS
ncbi:hypothetical protein [Pontibacter sp. SGAir0037]|uniref:hypothetical protein n=1 Tax=Pontibacter sp. SGAir0037 TaxID=2571030 RepID=UPI0010CD1BC4|nr:hypothetical protein [Pontibacter sp. SGAir0037]QCR22112.1 hypothetical protein C1N53_06995 [Pontibacter sp. SGAir0037]